MRLSGILFYGIFFALCLAASYAGADRVSGPKQFWRSWFAALVRFVFGVLVPFFYFFLSMALSPDWRSPLRSPYECMMETKIWLTPLAAWAWLSFYCVAVVRVQRVRSWMTLGLFTGCVGSLACESMLILFPKSAPAPLGSPFFLALITPLVYIPIWYGFHAYRSHEITRTRAVNYLSAFAGQIALWGWAAEKSVETFNALPDHPPCYIVTASAYGYPWLVRPRIYCDGNGARIFETTQLRRFRTFEKMWQISWPHSHRAARSLYDVAGPFIARRIRTPLLASVSYLGLKPAEWMAALCSALFFERRR